METLAEFAAEWRDEPESHLRIRDLFAARVDADPQLKAHRDYIEANQYGYGERAFHWLWKLIVDVLPPGFRFLEIGVHRGQVLSLVGMLAKRTSPFPPHVVGASTFDGRDTGEPRDYREDVRAICELFQAGEPRLIVGDSTASQTMMLVAHHRPFDVVYIDGNHGYEAVRSDILNYGDCVRLGGYLVMDDAANRLKLPHGIWPGHESVSLAVDSLLPPFGIAPQWSHLGNVGHNRVFQRVS